MGNRKKKNQGLLFAQDARRKQEIAQHGRILSMRPTVAHKSKKLYDRKQNKKELSSEI